MNAIVRNLTADQPNNPVPKEYHAGNMADAYNLAESDLNWASHAIHDLNERLDVLKETLHKDYGVHDFHFENIQNFFHMYEYLIDERQHSHKEEFKKYNARYQELKTGNKPKKDHGEPA